AAGAYKSFGEPFTRTFPSRENQEAMEAIVRELHEQLVAGIADGRELPPEQVQRWLERAPLSADEALEAGFVDQLAYSDQVEEWLKERHGSETSLRSFGAWSRLDGARRWFGRFGGPTTQVAVVHLQGPIVVENQARGAAIAARDVVPMLRGLRKDDRVGAVVLHVNSGGGSALASDLMWREVDELARTKPVVAAFEDTAASGGYYLAAPAAEILVRPGTLTGSIGVFGGKVVAAGGLSKLGIHTREILAAPNANLFSAGRGFTPAQRVRFKESLERTYAGFVKRVADGRGRPEDEIEPFCRGRVWTGRAALGHHLADQVGNVRTAVKRARDRAGLADTPIAVRHLSSYSMSMVSRVLKRVRPSFMAEFAPHWVQTWLRSLPSSRWLDLVLNHPEQALALLPFDLKVR
ncbi:MAG: S49 family peptidase, partial [Myxococcota bacterium]